MTDPITPERLAEIEARFASGRVVNAVTQRALLAEVQRLQAAVDEFNSACWDNGSREDREFIAHARIARGTTTTEENTND